MTQPNLFPAAKPMMFDVTPIEAIEPLVICPRCKKPSDTVDGWWFSSLVGMRCDECHDQELTA